MRKFSLITFVLVVISIFSSLNDPPQGPLKSELTETVAEQFEALSKNERMIHLLGANYSDIPNFIAQYQNTVLSWFGKSIDLDKYYINEKRLEEENYYFIKFGKALPYILISLSLISFVASFSDYKKEEN